MTRNRKVKCKVCGGLITRSRKSTCSEQCETVYNTTSVCVTCGERFSKNGESHCSSRCKRKFLDPYQGNRDQKFSRVKLQNSEEPKDTPQSFNSVGYYVYGWFEKGDVFPFYIGKGQGSRGMQKHLRSASGGGRNVPTSAERRRIELGIRFEVRVLRDGLTSEGAFLVESVLIDVFDSLGALLHNQYRGRSRREVPPLEIHERIDNA